MIIMFNQAALAHPNIALIKYWGNRDNTLRLPANGSTTPLHLVHIYDNMRICG